ncbi:RNA polymerase sigma factor [Nonomuraea glycinis]|uniref:DNA-directed RNA polymerase sigma-70 factor n=1 Tax=Nonomuraea glycinis TaxID=2047744 RepID=A0A918A296_9ACTN|nr:RNA polymerase sigma factor [Nonomuraea glycinis]MCA2175443.1 RNA polymerase sigma factor [Nonomuraea glycinis]GGP04731.1 DNA-directed RNA polymerase sigma-70 factor [Nonomuraea glycinis]
MHDPSSLRVAAETDDASVIANSRHDPEWFSVIFDRYFTTIHRYAAARLGPAAADDVAAETFLAGFDQRGRYDLTRPEAKAWLYGIATNLISRHRRDELRLYRALSRSVTRDDVESHADRVTDRVTAEQLSPRLARALKRLSQGDRDALMLVACADLSYAETAFALGIPIGTVSSRLNRARAKLRKSLGHAAKEV